MTAKRFLFLKSRATAWKTLAKRYREAARYVLEKPSLGAQVRNFLYYTHALEWASRMDQALEKVGCQTKETCEAFGPQCFVCKAREPDKEICGVGKVTKAKR